MKRVHLADAGGAGSVCHQVDPRPGDPITALVCTTVWPRVTCRRCQAVGRARGDLPPAAPSPHEA